MASSSTVTRMSSGDIIQIRTGVIQGIGPAGPVGPVGPQGLTGPQGTQGVPGPMGAVDNQFTYATSVGTPQNLASGTQTTLNMPTVVRDDQGLVSSLTQLTLPFGVWFLQLSVHFSKPSAQLAAGRRRISIWWNGTEYDAVAQTSVPDWDTEMKLSCEIDANIDAQTAFFRATSNDTVAIVTTAKMWATKMGPGSIGDPGPQGPAGPVGQTGPAGPQGPAGTLVNNTTTYASIGG